MDTFMLAHVFGALGLLGITTGDNRSDKKGVLISFLIANIMYGIQYYLLGATAGCVTCLIAAIRAVIYYLYERKNKKKPVLLLLIFLSSIIVAGSLTYEDVFSLFPIMGTLLVTWALWQSNMKIFRIAAFIDPINYFIYDLHVEAYIGLISAVLESVGAFTAIIRLDVLHKEIREQTEKIEG